MPQTDARMAAGVESAWAGVEGHEVWRREFAGEGASSWDVSECLDNLAHVLHRLHKSVPSVWTAHVRFGVDDGDPCVLALNIATTRTAIRNALHAGWARRVWPRLASRHVSQPQLGVRVRSISVWAEPRSGQPSLFGERDAS